MLSLQYNYIPVNCVSLHHSFQSNLLLCSDPEDEQGSPGAGKLKDLCQISSLN